MQRVYSSEASCLETIVVWLRELTEKGSIVHFEIIRAGEQPARLGLNLFNRSRFPFREVSPGTE